MANPTNPNRVVRVKDLNRFKEKSDLEYCARDSIYRLASEADVRGFVDRYIIVVD